MNIFDFYYRQIVTQSVMDWVFEQAELADHTLATDNALDGIVAGLDMSENHLGADLSVDILQGAGYSSGGQRIAESEPLTNLDCSVDEFGVPTAVAAGGNERWLSVFARFVRDPQEPALDGNGLQVFTKQLEDAELVVRQGAEASIGAASKPALLSNSVLLGDINLQQGQTTIVTVNHINYDRRQDWIRQTGSNVDTLVHGNARDAITELFAYVDSWSGSGNVFAFSDTWALADTVKGSSPPVVNVFGALNAIVHDLSGNTSPSLDGATKIGTRSYDSLNGYVSWANSTARVAMEAITDALDGHINGDAPEHPSTAVSATEVLNWNLFGFDDISAVNGSGLITNEAGGQATIVSKLSTSKTDLAHYIVVSGQAGFWTMPTKIKNGGVYSEPPDAVVIRDYGNQNILAGTDVDAQIEGITTALMLRNGALTDNITFQDYTFEGHIRSSRSMHVNCLTVGGGNPASLPTDELANGPNLTDASRGSWGHAESAKVSTVSDDLVDICKGWDWGRAQHCVYAVGDVYSGDCVVVKVFLDDGDEDFVNHEHAVCTADAGGTSLKVDNADAELFGVCSDGEFIYVLAQRAAAGAAAAVHCYNAKTWENGGNLTWLWTANIPALATGMGSRKTNNRIRVSGAYVYCLFGGEDTNDAGAGTPLARLNKADGTGIILGRGEGHDSGGVPAFSQGGLIVSRIGEIFYTSKDNGGTCEVVPSNIGLTAPGNGTMTLLTGEARDCLIGGYRNVIAPIGSSGSSTLQVDWWNWIDDLSDNGFDMPGVFNATFAAKGCPSDWDGTVLWIKFPANTNSSPNGDNWSVIGIHGAEFTNKTSYTYNPQRIYQINEVRDSDSGKDPGRICAWGPGLWNLEFENDSSFVSFMPFSKLSG